MTMSHNLSFGNMQVNLSSTGKPNSGKPLPQTPFRILIMGDFSGRANRGVCEPIKDSSSANSTRRPIKIDCDNIQSVFGKLAPTLHLPVGQSASESITVRFEDVESFHPDELFVNLELFQALRKTRQRLQDPSTYDAAAAEVRSWADEGLPGLPGQPDHSPTSTSDPSSASSPHGNTALPAQPADDGDMFTRLLGKPKSEPNATATSQAASSVESLIKQIVGPHIVPLADPNLNELTASVDAAITQQMQAILHHRDFQRLEAVWLSVDFLVRNIETDEQLQLFILDVTKDELAADLNSTDQLQSTGLYHMLVEQTIHTPGGLPWAFAATDYTFDATVKDAQLLGRLAKIGGEGGLPFFGAAHARLLGCDSLAATPDCSQWDQPVDTEIVAAWQALRELPVAKYLGLTAPRFLMRLPYGPGGEEIDLFEFDELRSAEFDPVEMHEQFLWANSAFFCALLLAQAFTTHGWDMSPGTGGSIDGLPAHMTKRDGETRMTPCAEIWLTDRAADVVIHKGVMPLMSIKSRNAVRLTRFQSLANPPQNVAGLWSTP